MKYSVDLSAGSVSLCVTKIRTNTELHGEAQLVPIHRESYKETSIPKSYFIFSSVL
jgi:hypothetical protein